MTPNQFESKLVKEKLNSLFFKNQKGQKILAISMFHKHKEEHTTQQILEGEVEAMII